MKSLSVLSLSLFGILWAACSSSITAATPPATSDDAGTDAPPAGASWTTGACGSCVAPACAAARQTCDTEPSCAAHGACADACAGTADGAIDPACLAACPRGANAVATTSRVAYDTCLTTSGPKGCAACAQPTTGPTSTSDILSQTCAGTSSDPTMCGKCEDLNCCETYAACVAEPECKLGVQPCLKACAGDVACDAKCYADHPNGVAAWARRSACIYRKCLPDCGGTADACLTCATLTSCGDPNTLCQADAGCFLINSCLDETCYGAITDSCLAACKAKQPPASGKLFDDWFSCTSVACTGVCQ